MSGGLIARELEAAVAGKDFTALVEGNAAFAFDMLRFMRAASPEDNLALGAYSISQALAMLYVGARGETAVQMQEALGYEGIWDAYHATFNGLDLELLSRNPDVLLRNANQVWR